MTARHAPPRRSQGRFTRARRYLRYKLLIPVLRSPHPPVYTGRGVAIGVFWGVTPFFGLQTVLMIATWQVLKRVFRKESSLVQAFIWSWVNNPVTMIPMYYAFYVTGLWLTGTTASVNGYDAFVALWDRSRRASTPLDGILLVTREIGTALLVGSIPYAVAGSALAYRWAVSIARARRQRLMRGGRARDARHA